MAGPGSSGGAIHGRKERFCRFCSEANVCSRAKCLRCETDIPAGLHAKHLQASFTEEVRRLSASSSSCVREKTRCWRTSPTVEDTELRELRAIVKRLESDRKKTVVQFEEPAVRYSCRTPHFHMCSDYTDHAARMHVYIWLKGPEGSSLSCVPKICHSSTRHVSP